jgi:hypothetical protein
VGLLYKLNPVDPELESAWPGLVTQPLNLYSLVKTRFQAFALFKRSLYRYVWDRQKKQEALQAAAAARGGAAGGRGGGAAAAGAQVGAAYKLPT